MNTPCLHCLAEIEIDPETHAALVGQTHFACPVCQGAVPVPSVTRPRLKLNPAPGAQADMAEHQASLPTNRSSASKIRNRNLLIFGSAALLVLGGIAFMLASKRSGDSHNTTQHIRNEIINNSYFQNLITSGVTTREDLDAIAAIRPYGNGFIGISAEPLEWERANGLAKRTGSVVLASDQGGVSTDRGLISWLSKTFPQEAKSPLWLTKAEAPAVLAGGEALSVTGSEGERRALLNWQPLKVSRVEESSGPASLDHSAPPTPTREQVDALETITRLGGKVERDSNLEDQPVVAINLENTKISDAGLNKIMCLSNVKSISLAGCNQVGDDGLKALGEMLNLESINLWACHQITDGGFKYLKNLHKLKKLYIWYTGQELIDGTGLADISNLTGIEALGLSHLNRLEPEKLRSISPLVNLKELHLDDCFEIGDESIDLILGFRNLQLLRLRGTRVTDAGLARLASAKSLKTLALTKVLSEEEALKLERDLAGYGKFGYKRPLFTEAGIRYLVYLRPDLKILRD